MRAAFLLIVLGATPAAARPPEALACALQAAPAGLDARVADVLVSRDSPDAQATLDQLHALTDACAHDQFLTDRQRDAYFTYVLGRMGRDGLDSRLAAAGVPSAVIDRALDIGPGNTNNPAERVTEGDLKTVGRALADAGHDPARIDAAGWGLIAAWIVATANMFEGLRTLD